MGQGATARFRRQADTVPRARGLIDRELYRCRADEDVVDRLVLAAAEACNNAILHSASGCYVVTVDIDTDDGLCTITVSDDGVGFDVPERSVMPEPESVGHRGLALMDALVDHVDVRSSTSGTTVVLRHRLGSNGQPTVALGNQSGRRAS